MAAEILLRLYEELNGFLPVDRRKLRFPYGLGKIRTVKELLGRLGIPEKLVELVLVNGASVDFSFLLHDGDFVSLYPVFESLEIRSLVRVRERPLRVMRFLAGERLLRLGHYLPKLGFDTLVLRSRSPRRLICAAEREQRVLLTRDPSLLKSPELSRIYLVRAAKPRDQLLEVLSRFDLFDTLYLSGSWPMLVRILKSRAASK